MKSNSIIPERRHIIPIVVLGCNSTLQLRGELVHVLGAGLQIPNPELKKLIVRGSGADKAEESSMAHPELSVYGTEDAEARAGLPTLDSRLLHLVWSTILGSLLKSSVSQFHHYFNVFLSSPLSASVCNMYTHDKVKIIFLHIYIIFCTLKSISEAFFHVIIISHDCRRIQHINIH